MTKKFQIDYVITDYCLPYLPERLYLWQDDKGNRLFTVPGVPGALEFILCDSPRGRGTKAYRQVIYDDIDANRLAKYIAQAYFRCEPFCPLATTRF